MEIWVFICGLFVLLGFEIRYRLIIEQISESKAKISRLSEEIIKLKDEVKKKKDVLERI